MQPSVHVYLAPPVCMHVLLRQHAGMQYEHAKNVSRKIFAGSCCVRNERLPHPGAYL